MYTIDIDTGGTFTDGYIVGDDTDVTVKVETTPHDLTLCFYECIEEGARRLDLPTPELLDRTRVIRFSSTIATNAAVQLSGPKLGVIVSKGHEQDLYGEPTNNPIGAFVPANLIVGVAEEVDEAGRVLAEPAPEEIDEKVRWLLENGARMLVISLRNAHVNPANELAIRRFIDNAYPRHYLGAVPMLTSHQVARVPNDALRTSTAIVNAYFHRSLVHALYKAEDLVRRQHYHYPLMIVTADYGVTRVAKTKAISTYQSGPASGVRGAHVLGARCGHDCVLSIDVGGTTSDVSFIAHGQPVTAAYRPINGVDVAQRIPDIVSFGVGGGSKIRLADGQITIGPDSQGAVPGPACFGLGGDMVTPTDLWLTLGYLDPEAYLGGRKRLQPDKARAAVDKQLGQPLGLDVEAAALKAREALESNLARRVSERGIIPEHVAAAETTLYAVGGGAGLLAAGLAQALGIGRVYVPATAAVFSAFGASTLDVSHSYEEILALGAAQPQMLQQALAKLVERARRDMRGEGYADDELSCLLEAECFAGSRQIGHVTPQPVDGAVPEEIAAFVAGAPDGGQYVILRLTATCPKPHPDIRASGGRAGAAQDAQVATRSIRLSGGEADAPVYRFDRLPLGARIPGPAVVENEHTSVLVPGGLSFAVDEFGSGTMEV